MAKGIAHILGPGNDQNANQIEHRILRRDGEVRHIIARVCVVRGPDGRAVRTYGVNQDVTEVKRTEEQLKRANQKLRLLSGITRHDIRNQLTVLHGAVSLAQLQPDEPVAADLLTRMERSVVSIGSHIDFARDYQDLGAASPRWHHLGALVASLPISREIERLDIAGLGDLWVYADPLLRKVFHNILEDTLKYGARPAAVQLSYIEEEDGLRLIYEDRGPGVPPEDKERIFEKGVGKGDGLGLFLSREILAMTGIAIAERGERGKGVRFELSVPAGHYRREGPPPALPGGAPSEAVYR